MRLWCRHISNFADFSQWRQVPIAWRDSIVFSGKYGGPRTHWLFVIVPSLSDAERKCGSVCGGISINAGLEIARLLPHTCRIVYPLTAWKVAVDRNVCPVTEPGKGKGPGLRCPDCPWRGISTITSCSWTSQRPNVSFKLIVHCWFTWFVTNIEKELMKVYLTLNELFSRQFHEKILKSFDIISLTFMWMMKSQTTIVFILTYHF